MRLGPNEGDSRQARSSAHAQRQFCAMSSSGSAAFRGCLVADLWWDARRDNLCKWLRRARMASALFPTDNAASGIKPKHGIRNIRAGRCLLGLDVVDLARLASVRVDSVRRAEGGGATMMRRRLTVVLAKLGIQFTHAGVIRRPEYGKKSPFALLGRARRLIHRMQSAPCSSQAHAGNQGLAAANVLPVRPQERSLGSLKGSCTGEVRIEGLTEADQDKTFDEMIRQYMNPSAEVRARYAAVGWATERALERTRIRRLAQRPRKI
jgi:hypothetical protein